MDENTLVQSPSEKITAVSNLVGMRAAAIVLGGVVHFDKDTPAHAGLCRGIVRATVSSGSPAYVLLHGPITNQSWAWTPLLPIYVGTDGQLTQTRPTSGLVQEVAKAESTTRIFIEVKTPLDFSDRHFTHEQSGASATWTVTHNLGKFPAVTVVDSGGSQVIGSIVHDSINQLTISFSAAFSGKAFCN